MGDLKWIQAGNNTHMIIVGQIAAVVVLFRKIVAFFARLASFENKITLRQLAGRSNPPERGCHFAGGVVAAMGSRPRSTGQADCANNLPNAIAFSACSIAAGFISIDAGNVCLNSVQEFSNGHSNHILMRIFCKNS